MDAHAFFNGWSGPLRIALVGVLAYFALLLCLRLAGKRTLSKWNEFDFAITVALGSALANAVLSESVPLADGITGIAVLVLLQYVLTHLAMRSPRVRRVIQSRPTALLRDGRLLPDAMRDQRVSETEVAAAIRGGGFGCFDEVAVVVLETNGTFSVIGRAHVGSGSALADVENARHHDVADRA
ncbi:DUF421 domain-containing protein [Cognatilysobacter segetis]|uniref:DUF421 domain-containing protein n=1 Tax=Cognatilysobacter segetis TaxID=2492394 RepID=UPI001060679B|nr:YetF domain-containing protein [Lysobacter segetis]